MIPIIPWYIELTVTGVGVAIAVSLWTAVSIGAGRSGLPPEARRRIRIGSGVFLGGWLGAVLLLAPAPGSLLRSDPFHVTPHIPLFFGVSLTIALLALWRSADLRRALAAVPLPMFHLLQVWRIAGIAFVVLVAQRQIPGHFGLPAGWGDVAIGLTAPLVGWTLARGMRGARTAAIGWNALGLLDLVVAVGMGTGLLAPLLAPGLGRVAPAAAMGVFPMILVPAFEVPVSVLLHVFALTALLGEIRIGAKLAPTAAR